VEISSPALLFKKIASGLLSRKYFPLNFRANDVLSWFLIIYFGPLPFIVLLGVLLINLPNTSDLPRVLVIWGILLPPVR
jgi:hypothetical protein